MFWYLENSMAWAAIDRHGATGVRAVSGQQKGSDSSGRLVSAYDIVYSLCSRFDSLLVSATTLLSTLVLDVVDELPATPTCSPAWILFPAGGSSNIVVSFPYDVVIAGLQTALFNFFLTIVLD
jgi:hypothetical protein